MAAMLERVSNLVRAVAPRPRALRTVLAAALLTVATYAAAAQMRGDHPDTYVVKRGDTLWDIAGRFLQRPWLCGLRHGPLSSVMFSATAWMILYGGCGAPCLARRSA